MFSLVSRIATGLLVAGALGVTFGCVIDVAPAMPQTALETAPTGGLSEQAQYAAFARAVNLRPGDVPGFAESAPAKSTNETSAPKCHLSALSGQVVAGFVSARFSTRHGLESEETGSSVAIERTPAAARQNIAALESALGNRAARRCLSREIGAALERGFLKGTRHGNKVQLLHSDVRLGRPAHSPPPEGAEAFGSLSVGVNMLIRVAAHGREARLAVDISVDSWLFAIGRAQVALTTAAVAEPFPTNLQTRLFMLLTSRAVSAAPEYPALVH
jgi:hypothetical protein